MKKQFVLTLAAIGIAAVAPQAHAQHAHLNAGAQSTNQNAQLNWANGADFIAGAVFGYVKTLEYTNAGQYSGYYQGGITLTALPATSAYGGPDPAAAALGSQIQCRISCLEAPAGGEFGFWEAGATNPTIALAVGQASTNLWPLSESDGSPGADPYGHIHGRRFTATRAGVYKVGFTAVDTSTNGTGGGPIHTPSVELPVWFQAGVNIREIEPDVDHTHVRFGAAAGKAWQLEASASLATNTVWTPIGAPVTGDDYFHEIEDDTPVSGQRFFRVNGTPITP